MDYNLLERLLLDMNGILIDVIEVALEEDVFDIHQDRELLFLVRDIVRILCFH